MAPQIRRARVRALAKLNLSLEVLHKRGDGFHEIRTIFQTISLGDRIELEYRPSSERRVFVDSDIEIPDNILVRAAHAVLNEGGRQGNVRFGLSKHIPMGGGLGGGSSDAAAVLLALPVLIGKAIPLIRLMEIGKGLGSDVPFFLLGGTALGLGRGTELYPLCDADVSHALVVAPGVHVSTPEAYKALGRTSEPVALTPGVASPKINNSQPLAMLLGGGLSAEGWAGFCSNDFEPVVFRQHPELEAIKEKLAEAGAFPALMSGSGSSLFGVFPSRGEARQARIQLKGTRTVPVSFVSRQRYHALWWRQLADHIEPKRWPPRSRYAQ